MLQPWPPRLPQPCRLIPFQLSCGEPIAPTRGHRLESDAFRFIMLEEPNKSVGDLLKDGSLSESDPVRGNHSINWSRAPYESPAVHHQPRSMALTD